MSDNLKQPVIRKLCAWVLCLLVLHPAAAFLNSSAKKEKEMKPLLELKEKFDEARAGSGKI